MSIFQAIVLGIVQGLTEFLPVSSSGHLVMFQNFFGLDDQLFLTVALHVGTLMAVFIMFWKDICYLIRHPFSPLAKKIVFATIPTVIIVFLFKSLVESSFTSMFFILGFTITGIVLISTEMLYKNKKIGMEVSYKSSFWIGVAQGLASFPGISRSGSTICMGLLLGEDKDNVAKFSFLLSIPIIIASCAYEIIFHSSNLALDVFPIIIGTIVSMIAGILAIKLMLNLVSKVKFMYFGVYLISLSVILVIFYNFV